MQLINKVYNHKGEFVPRNVRIRRNRRVEIIINLAWFLIIFVASCVLFHFAFLVNGF